MEPLLRKDEVFCSVRVVAVAVGVTKNNNSFTHVHSVLEEIANSDGFLLRLPDDESPKGSVRPLEGKVGVPEVSPGSVGHKGVLEPGEGDKNNNRLFFSFLFHLRNCVYLAPGFMGHCVTCGVPSMCWLPSLMCSPCQWTEKDSVGRWLRTSTITRSPAHTATGGPGIWGENDKLVIQFGKKNSIYLPVY